MSTEPNRDLSLLAPRFRAAVEAAIADCVAQGYPVRILEGLRSQERQAWLYAQGRTRPGSKVTNAPTNLTSWHGYGLAIDILHATLAYEPLGKGKDPSPWFRHVGQIFKAHGCSWGGDWSHPDMPHMQWGNMPASPAAQHKKAKQLHGNEAVWALVGAGGGGPTVAPVAADHPLLRKGAHGEPVRALQTKLGLTADGSFGPATEAAVKAFQAAHNLTADGVVGSKTWSALGV